MNVPIQLSSQLDECLKELNVRKDAVMNQILIYESVNRVCSAIQDPEQNNFDNLEVNSLDSNYESDNNSVRSFQSTRLPDLNKKSIISKTFSLEAAFQIECKISGINLHNSDDSDATVNDMVISNFTSNNTKNEINPIKVLPNITIKSLKITNELSTNNSSSTSSDSTTTPGSPKTPTPYSVEIIENSSELKDNSETNLSLADINLKLPSAIGEHVIPSNKGILNFSRQISDGYSSSNTPLSASSINETVNPFFQPQHD